MTAPARLLDREGLDRLIAELTERGHTVMGPTLRDRAIVYGELRTSADLPIGWTDVQEGGTYRVARRDDEACFGYNLGPRSFKEYRLPPEVGLWRARRDGEELAVEEPADEPVRYAFIGARSCELHAMGILDNVLLGNRYPDGRERARLDEAFVVAVQCGQAAGTCFCASMSTGPRASEGFDLALTELLEGEHRFVVEVGSEAGAAVASSLDAPEAGAEDLRLSGLATERALGQMGRSMDVHDIVELLERNLEHPRWDDVAARCLSCGNCTMVCPTCFCTSVEDVTDLGGATAERIQRWASCFEVDHSHIHGGAVRPSTRSRYRQWMTHKLATWWQQFDTSGCVGCGRCITWCPVAIDITAEVAAIRATDGEVADG